MVTVEELERELRDDDDDNEDKDGGINIYVARKRPLVSFLDVRTDDSGIIRLVSRRRHERLRVFGRLPCPHCPSWHAGARGLWWHSIGAHGIAYANATESASGVDASASSLSIVPYVGGGGRGGWDDGGASADTTKSRERPRRIRRQHLYNGGSHCDNDDDSDDNDYNDVDEDEDSNLLTKVTCLNNTSATAIMGDGAFALVKMGKYEEFLRCIEEGSFCPRTHLDRNGASLLHWAAGCGHLDFVSHLVERCNCCPNQGQRGKRSFSGRTPLHWAARNGHLSIVTYLVLNCHADVDATTSDGTTAFCWASWQGHLDIMKFLHQKGCDIHRINNFGCNAVLWNAQGAGTAETMAWLFESGADFNLVNSNGHSAFHKAAQRGSIGAVKWLADKFLNEKSAFGSFVGPDAEGHCPFDLCSMEGHIELARKISIMERDWLTQLIGPATSVENLLENYSEGIPSWLLQDLLVAKDMCDMNAICYMAAQEGGACHGVRRLTMNLMAHFTESVPQVSNIAEADLTRDFSDID
ncbi:hypothetical protein ACHAXA_002153 [Cyclostephanos tholiformis]|uniref:Uncharacterized protein n=1 Tax=Cyclostephanos tholiformis TaxID=382380 RepID=A0ABD3R1P1_9STRA